MALPDKEVVFICCAAPDGEISNFLSPEILELTD